MNESETTIPLEDGELEATLAIPDGARGIAVFAHGSGSGRHSPRNRYVAERLTDAGFGALLLDLLTPEEERRDRATGDFRFDVPRLSTRLVQAINWLATQRSAASLAVGCYGASTGAAAALVAAAARPRRVDAVVSRGGRPDLAAGNLELVEAPTLLIVGERDPAVLELNQEAAERMHAPVTIETVAGATHLFEEEGALDRVGELTVDWFARHVGGETSGPPA